MTINIGNLDRILRVVVGGGLLALAFVGPQTPWGFVGIIPLGTALIGYCPADRLLGICTRSKTEQSTAKA